MALTSLNFLTGNKRSVRIRFDEGVSVEAYGRYFSLDIPTPIAVSVSDNYILFVLDKEGDNLAAYTFDGAFAFGLSELGVTDSLLSGSVMTAEDAVLFLSRYPEAEVVVDHTYYLATTRDYRMLWIDLDARELFFRT